MINITIELLMGWFNKFNKEFFEGKIKPVNCAISKTTGAFGKFKARTCTIEISTAYIRSERDYINTFLHEMCHAYVRQVYGRKAQPHGPEWNRVAHMITCKTNGKYGNIQRVGGGQDGCDLRETKLEKFVVFTDYNGHVSIGKYSHPQYVERLKNLGGVKDNSVMYYFTSSDPTLCRFKLRKVNTRHIHWNYLMNVSFDYIKEHCVDMTSETYTKMKKSA